MPSRKPANTSAGISFRISPAAMPSQMISATADTSLLRRSIQTPAEIIRSATLVGAEVVRMQNRLGVITPGALADLLVIDGDPLEDLTLMTEQGANIPIIMKNGELIKNTLKGDF